MFLEFELLSLWNSCTNMVLRWVVFLMLDIIIPFGRVTLAVVTASQWISLPPGTLLYKIIFTKKEDEERRRRRRKMKKDEER